jgi:single-strand DNA-binding protein
MNKSILLGRLTKAPEIRYSQEKEMKVALFTLAVNRKYVKQGEERQVDFINIVAYSKLAEFSEKYLRQGLQICVCGRIQTRNYEDKNKIKRYVTEVIAEELDFADSFKKEDYSILNSDKPVNTQNNTNTNGEVFPSENDLPF